MPSNSDNDEEELLSGDESARDQLDSADETLDLHLLAAPARAAAVC
jgi:hypothetical protein